MNIYTRWIHGRLLVEMHNLQVYIQLTERSPSSKFRNFDRKTKHFKLFKDAVSLTKSTAVHMDSQRQFRL